MNALVLAIPVLEAGVVFAQVASTPAVFDMAGGVTVANQMTNVMAVGQSHAGVSRNGRLVNYGGFIQSLLLKPRMDHDGDGLPDEVDLDNDNDSLEDSVEIDGSMFSPPIATGVNDPDSDDDGMVDGAEWIADTNPTNPASVLVITGLGRQEEGIRVEWAGGIGARQYLLRKHSLTSMEAWTAIFTNEPPTAVAANYVDQVTNAASFYRIQAERP